MGAVLLKVIQVAQEAMPVIYKTIEKSNGIASFELKFVIWRNCDSSQNDIALYTYF